MQVELAFTSGNDKIYITPRHTVGTIDLNGEF